MRGQAVTISTLSWVVLIFIFLTFIFLYGLESFNILTDARSSEALARSVDRLYGTSESLPIGSSTTLAITIPSGVEDVQVLAAPDSKWELRLTYRGELVRRASFVKILYLPENLLEIEGLHHVRIRKENEYAAIVEDVQG